MENNSIREFTCNDCQEVNKVDWSKIRPDLDDGTSNIGITFDDGKYIYVGECDNCGNLVEIEPPVPELEVTNVDVDKDGMYIEITDKVTNRSCWIEAWQDKNGEWEYDFNQYIFHLDDDNDMIAKMFQEDLGNYAEEVFECVMGAIDEHEEEYNKLQESKTPTMRDRLKEVKSESTDIERVKKALNYIKNEYNELGTDDYEFLYKALTTGKTAKEKIKNALNYMEDEYNELGTDDYEFLYNILTESKKIEDETNNKFKTNVALHNLGIDNASKLMQDLDMALEDNDETQIKSIVTKLKNSLSANDYKSFIKTYYPEYKNVLEKLVGSKKAKTESVSWDYFNKFENVIHKYLPRTGEGDTLATQIVTAINNLIYHWYNDGDVYDNNYAYFATCGNDLSSYANWLYKYVDGTQDTLDKIKDCFDGNDYEKIIKRLADEFLTDEYLSTCKDVEKQGSIYDCSGPFEFNDGYEVEEGYTRINPDTNTNKKVTRQKKTEASSEDVEVNDAGGFYKGDKYYLGDPNGEYDEVEYGDNIAENLWTAACCGDNKYLQNYYDNGGKPNVRCNGFGGSKVSLIIGALNNKCWDTIELLKNNGETILKSELSQYKRLMAEHNYEDEITKSARDESLVKNRRSKKVTEAKPEEANNYYMTIQAKLTECDKEEDIMAVLNKMSDKNLARELYDKYKELKRNSSNLLDDIVYGLVKYLDTKMTSSRNVKTESEPAERSWELISWEALGDEGDELSKTAGKVKYKGKEYTFVNDQVEGDLSIIDEKGNEIDLDTLRDEDEDFFLYIRDMDYCYQDLKEAKFKDKVKAIKGKLKTEAMNGFNSENSVAQQLYDDFVEFENIDADKWNRSTAEEREKMVRPQVIKFYKQNRARVDDNWDDFMELLEYWNYHTEYKIFNDLAYDEILNVDESKKVTEGKTSEMDNIDIIMELEGGELTIEDVEDWNAVKAVAETLQSSQGFYNRLLRDMENTEEEYGGVENLPFPITM